MTMYLLNYIIDKYNGNDNQDLNVSLTSKHKHLKLCFRSESFLLSSQFSCSKHFHLKKNFSFT